VRKSSRELQNKLAWVTLIPLLRWMRGLQQLPKNLLQIVRKKMPTAIRISDDQEAGSGGNVNNRVPGHLSHAQILEAASVLASSQRRSTNAIPATVSRSNSTVTASSRRISPANDEAKVTADPPLSAVSPSPRKKDDKQPSIQDREHQEERLDDEQEITYKEYSPKKLKFGRPHPDPVVENSTLGSVEPPDITYNLVMPADIIAKGKLSSLQLEAVAYGCQRHMMDLPTASKTTKSENVDNLDNYDDSIKYKEHSHVIEKTTPVRAGFLLGDGAGMGKGRTLAGFVVENIARGRKKHIWISVSSDLYEDAKRDLSDLGLSEYAKTNCLNLSKLPYGSLDKYDQGVMFATYSTLISKKKDTNQTRLGQLLEWCGENFDGLIMLDECHKAKTIVLDPNGNPKKAGKYLKCTLTATRVVELQNSLPRARVVYCSATSVSEEKNLGFMSRLGLWGPGTEHPSGFDQFVEGIHRLGTGAMELHAMHLKSIGAICARTLSYEDCEFALVDVESGSKAREVYNSAAELWSDLLVALEDRCAKLHYDVQLNDEIDMQIKREEELHGDLLFHMQLHCDSDSENSNDEGEDLLEQRKLRRKYRKLTPMILKGLYWGAHQRFFRSLCIAAKVDKAIELSKQALAEDKCVVIGLQSTGEARSVGAARAAGIDKDEGGHFDAFVSAPDEELKRVIMKLFPLPPKPAGIIAPEFLNVLKKEIIEDPSLRNDDKLSDGNNSTDSGIRLGKRNRRGLGTQKSVKKQKKSERIRWNMIDTNQDESLMDHDERVHYLRMKNYRNACEEVQRWLEMAEKLEVRGSGRHLLLVILLMRM